MRRASSSACSSTRDLERQALETRDVHLLAAGRALGAVRLPELAVHADPPVRTALLGDLDLAADQRLGADLDLLALRVAHPPGGLADLEGPGADDQRERPPPFHDAEDDERERDPEGQRAALRSTRASPSRRVTPSASRRSRRSWAGRR